MLCCLFLILEVLNLFRRNFESKHTKYVTFLIIWAFSSCMELLQKTWWWTGLERGSC